jgi:hypothetical protein
VLAEANTVMQQLSAAVQLAPAAGSVLGSTQL